MGLAFFYYSSLAGLQGSPNNLSVYPDYEKLVSFDPAREGGHLLPNLNLLAIGAYRGQPVRFVTNSMGFRSGREYAYEVPRGVKRILFLGDSFVDGLRTDQERTIGFQLEKKLNEKSERVHFEVLLSGHNNPVNAWYYFQEHGRRFHPDVVILGVTLGSDLTWHNYRASFLPEKRGGEENGVQLRPRLPVVMHSRKMDSLFLPDGAYTKPTILDSIYDVEMQWRKLLAGKSNFFAQAVPPLMGPFPPSRHHVYAADFCLSLGLFYQPLMREIDQAYRDFEEVLANFNSLVKNKGSSLLVVLFPARIQVLPADWNLLQRAYSLDARKFDLHYPNRRLLAFCREQHIDFLDTLPVLKEARRQGEQELFFPKGDMHFNERAQEKIAEALMKRTIEVI